MDETVFAAALLRELAAQTRWEFGCHNFPASYSSRARWIASDALNSKLDDVLDFRVAYRHAADALAQLATPRPA